MEVEAITTLSNGATFFRGDLHIHSFGASHDVKDPTATPDAIVNLAIDENLKLIAITDHNEISNVRETIKQGEENGLIVIAGVELSTPEGHILCYAPNADALERFYGHLTIVERSTKDSRCQTGMADCLTLLEREGGFGILAHVDLKGNAAFESNMPNMTPAKLDILCHRALAGIEVSKADCSIFYNDQESDIQRRTARSERLKRLGLGSQQFLARVLNSDAHTLSAVGRNAKNAQRITRYKMDSPSYTGLRLALDSADSRVRLEDEIPRSIPIIQGVHFSGAFLDNQGIHFSPNLTCIIGGRGSGKSMTFEGLRLLGIGYTPENESVVDTDVWPDEVSLMYRDETNACHAFGRSKGCELENIDDPTSGPISFPIESYRQGETNEISRKLQSDPMALLTFLDRLVAIEDEIAEEDGLRIQLNELSPQVEKARGNVLMIPNFKRDLNFKQSQIARLKQEKGVEIIELQQRLESEKRIRNSVEVSLTELFTAITLETVITISKGIKDTIAGGSIELGGPEAEQIRDMTVAYEKTVAASSDSLKHATTTFIAEVRTQIASWRAKESQTSGEIEKKKKELLSLGIRLDMPFIQKLVSDEAKTAQSLRNLQTWVPELKRLEKAYADLLKNRWEARNRIATIRTAFAVRASKALQGRLSDLSVTLKFDESSLSPESEKLISDAMGWRTSGQLKAHALIRQLTLPRLLECVRRKSSKPIVDLKNENGAPIFLQNEAEVLLARLSENDILAQLESVAIDDMPRLSVTKRVDDPSSGIKYIPREFKRLSLGQQQSVLLALMLTSESKAPLIIDQPEDHLDSEFIYKTLIPVIRYAKERRQVIIVTHNANIAVLGDAEQIIALKATNERATIMARGSIDEPATRELACAILEGSREAFERRSRIYGVGR